MTTPLLASKFRATTEAGLPLSFGKVYTYLAGTLTPAPTYTDAAGTTPNTNPVTLDSTGRASIWLASNVSYKFVTVDSSGNPAPDGTVDNFTSTESSLAEPAGAGKVGFGLSVTYPSNTVGSYLQQLSSQVVNVRDYVTGGTGTAADPWTGWSTAITWKIRTRYEFSDGYFAYATSPNFALFKLELIGTANTTIMHTGTGYAMLMDGGPTPGTTEVERITVSGIRLESNAAATGGLYMRGCGRCHIQMSFRSVPGAAASLIYCVLNTYDLTHTALYEGATVSPAIGIYTGRRGTTETTAACTFTRWFMENCTTGLLLEYCSNAVFLGGSAEAGNNGIYIAPTSYLNSFLGADLEVNSVYDILCDGDSNLFLNIVSVKATTINGKSNCITGGTFNDLNIGGQFNVIDGAAFGNVFGTFNDSGIGTVKRSIRNVSTNTMQADAVPNGVAIGSGGTAIKRHLSSALTSLTFPAPGAVPGTSTDQTITVGGAAVDDTVSISLPAGLSANYIVRAFVSSANTVTVRSTQIAGAAAAHGPLNYRVDVWQH